MPAPENPPWSDIRCLLLDCDGVLTDGGVYLGEENSSEYRRFDIKDGYGLVQLLARGIVVGVISKSPSTPVRTRARNLGIREVHLGVPDKVACATDILERHSIPWEATAFMGDDAPDLQLLQKVGYPLAPADAVETVRKAAVWVAGRPGGYGAVREAADRILRSMQTTE